MSATTEAGTKLTPDDLLGMPDAGRYELVDGDLQERNVGVLSSIVGAIVTQILTEYCLRTGLAWPVDNEGGYRCFPDEPGKVRRADCSCILRDRLPPERFGDGYITVAPDLAVEVLSPNDNAYEVDNKVEEYLRAGTRLVWVVNPSLGTVRVHRADGPGVILRVGDELSGDDVLPGFRCRVADLFPAGAVTGKP